MNDTNSPDPPIAAQEPSHAAPKILWEPTEEVRASANLTRFMGWLKRERGVALEGYPELWRWSVNDLETFWGAVWEYYDVGFGERPSQVLSGRTMPGARWFEGARLNYAEQILTRASRAHPAVVVAEDDKPVRSVSIETLTGRVGALAAALRERGVTQNDHVAAYVPNIEEAVVALLAVTSIGAVWTACSPEFGTRSVIDRFAQVEPVALIAVDGYRFNGRAFDRREVVGELKAALPSVRNVILIRSLHPDEPAPGELADATFDEVVSEPQAPIFERVPSDHPLWVLYSSGTTGLPKGIVHSHGGIVAEHLKALGLDSGLGEGDRWFLYSSTSWMAWNYLVGGLLHGATPVLFNGSPGHPWTGAIWELAAEVKATVLLVGSAYVSACMKEGVDLGPLDLSALEVLNATGSPLPDAGWEWLATQLDPGTRIESTCGGTDVCTAYFGGNALTPVYLGEISCQWLGVNAESWNARGESVVDEPGEFVVLSPMPSMPVLWGDADGERLASTYFDLFPGVWRQGDSITMTSRGTVRVHGRSDATLNRGGVRLGSAEIYGVLGQFAEVTDALVVGAELADGNYAMPLFVVLATEGELDDDLRSRIASAIRKQLSPRHVPDEIVQVPVLPHTLTGKALEIPIKRILQGTPAAQAASAGSVDHPEALAWFETFARERDRASV